MLMARSQCHQMCDESDQVRIILFDIGDDEWIKVPKGAFEVVQGSLLQLW